MSRTALPVRIAPLPAWIADLVNEILEEMVDENDGQRQISLEELKERLTEALRRRLGSLDATAGIDRKPGESTR